VSSEERERIKALEQEVKVLRRANEIMRTTNAFPVPSAHRRRVDPPFRPGLAVRYSERLTEADVESSVGNRGDSDDNVLAETINGLYRAELIHRRVHWKTRQSLKLATLEWVA